MRHRDGQHAARRASSSGLNGVTPLLPDLASVMHEGELRCVGYVNTGHTRDLHGDLSHRSARYLDTSTRHSRQRSLKRVCARVRVRTLHDVFS